MSHHPPNKNIPQLPQRPPLIRLANRIRAQVLHRQTHNTDGLQYQLGNLSSRVEQLASINRRLALCQEHGFVFARGKVLEDLRYALLQIPGEVNSVERRIPPEGEALSLAEIAKELEQLEEEFGDWQFDAEESALIVTTDIIELEGISLGAFEIRLYLHRLGQSSASPPYTVVALEPNCPSSNDAVTHPHVSDNHLCEGDASVPIHGALEEGRICDFFVLVRSVLDTYNPGSPYVALDNWYGTPCHECGASVDEDERYYCEACDYDFCGDCTSCCHCCDRSLCLTCLDECPVCEERVCNHCLKRCKECGKSCCESCLDEGLCPDCVDQLNEENSHDDDESIIPPTAPIASVNDETDDASSASAESDTGSAIPDQQAA